MNYVNWGKNLEFDVDRQHKAVVLELVGTIDKYDPETPRISLFGKDAIEADLNLVVDLRRLDSIPNLLDLFDVANDIIDLYKINPHFKLGFVVKNKIQEGVARKLRSFAHEEPNHINYSRSSEALLNWIAS